MLLDKTVIAKWNSANKKWYEGKGYLFTKMGDEFEVKIEDLTNSSGIKVNVECDCKECTTPIIKPIPWHSYKTGVKENGKYYCRKCSKKLYGGENTRKTKLKNGKSFEQWCIDNKRQDVLDRWDYELNTCKPNEIGYSANKKYYFKCPRRIHDSELKNINSFASGQEGSIECKQCNSFAQYLIDTYGDNALEKYWDYEKNIFNPWEISRSCNKFKIYIKCQKKDYHDSYDITCGNFIIGRRCTYCRGFKIHPLDSLGTLYPKSLEIWSDKNKKSPYEYAPHSGQYAYCICKECEHEWRSKIYNISSGRNCPQCNKSKGEKECKNILINNNWIEIIQEDFEQLNDEDKYSLNYFITQKEFYGLLGLGRKNLSYDFYVPKLNLLIEYHGGQHEKFTKGIHKTIKDFERQLEHDNRKCIYADNNNIKLLVIWYWDFDRIEEILSKAIVGQFNVELENDDSIRTASKFGKKINDGVV